MRILLIILAFSISRPIVYASGQIPDYIIYKQDTVPLFANPLEQYFTLVGNREIPDFNGGCGSTACWRGYKAIWELKNDSLFLRQIAPCHSNCGKSHDGNLFKMFGKNDVFASWYSGQVIIPRGNHFKSYNMGYASLYDYEEHIEFKEGITKNKSIISNLDRIKNIKLDYILRKNIQNLKDTFLYYLVNAVNWKEIDNSNEDIWCDDDYLLYYDSTGKLRDIKILDGLSDTLNEKDSVFYHKLNQICSEKFRETLSRFSLNYLKPHRNFTILVKLFYLDNLEIRECELYYRRPTEKELRDWVKEQMTPK